MTAILATIGALFSDMGGATKANAGLFKNNAEMKTEADKLEAEATSWNLQSDAQMHLHHRWARATTALQISIALAAIALLTRRKWLECDQDSPWAFAAHGLQEGTETGRWMHGCAARRCVETKAFKIGIAFGVAGAGLS